MNISRQYPSFIEIIRWNLRDLRVYLARVIKDLSGSPKDALLYRTRKGENPYDFSNPENQRTYLTVNSPQWR